MPSLGRGYPDDHYSLLRTTEAAFGIAPVGVDADAMAYDPVTKRVFVMNADGNSITAIDAGKNETLKTVRLGGAPEMAVADGHGKLFINIASTNEIVSFDAAALFVTARWPVAACEKSHGLAMDESSGRLFVSCVNARMLVVNAESGKILANLPIGKGTDCAAFDPVRKLAFSSNSDGTLSVIAERDANSFELLGDAKTAPGARTMAIDSKTGHIFLATPMPQKSSRRRNPAENRALALFRVR